jgi:hypothetical protein
VISNENIGSLRVITESPLSLRISQYNVISLVKMFQKLNNVMGLIILVFKKTKISDRSMDCLRLEQFQERMGVNDELNPQDISALV